MKNGGDKFLIEIKFFMNIAFYLYRMMASRVALDGQGRLILRENGKIILPYEHFANAVMLKHMNGPHGLHLGLEGTIRAVSGYIYILCLLDHASS